MLLPRRTFLRYSMVFGASAVLFSKNARLGLARTIGAADGQLSDELLNDPLYRFTRETFEPYVGGYFEAAVAGDRTVALKLLKVDSYTPKSDTKLSSGSAVKTDSFSLLFNAEGALPSFKSTYQIKHGALGEFKLFLSGQKSANGEIFYEAVFNRLS
jgi:uncharacterized protein DUF6916